MGNIFYLIGLGLAGFAGYSDFQWYFIFISSLTMAIGYFIIRAPQIQGIASKDGTGAIPKLLSMQIVLFSIFTAPIYFLGAYFA